MVGFDQSGGKASAQGYPAGTENGYESPNNRKDAFV